MRIYVLVTCCDPIKVFLYKDGLARFATEKYVVDDATKANNMFMHLTNYAINKKNAKFFGKDSTPERGSS